MVEYSLIRNKISRTKTSWAELVPSLPFCCCYPSSHSLRDSGEKQGLLEPALLQLIVSRACAGMERGYNEQEQYILICTAKIKLQGPRFCTDRENQRLFMVDQLTKEVPL